MLRKIEGKRRRDEVVGWHMSLSKLWEMVKDKKAWHTAIHGVTKNRILLSD